MDAKLPYEELRIRFEERQEKEGAVPFQLISPSHELQGMFKIPVTQEEIDRALASISRFSKNWVQRSALRETLDPIKEIGTKLFAALFDGSIGEAYRITFGQMLSAGTHWRLRLIIRDPRLAMLPWEFLYDGRDFLALSAQASVIRQMEHIPELSVSSEKSATNALRVLFVSAAVGDLGSAIEQEIIAVKKIAKNGRIKLTIVRDATAAEFRTALAKGEYDVLLFGGMAKEVPERPWDDSQVLVLQGEPNGGLGSYEMGKNELLDALRPQPRLRLIYLSASNTDRLAGVLSQVVPATIGVRCDVAENAWMVFTSRLLEAALAGLWLDEAIAHARRAIDLQDPGDRGWGMPVAYMSTLGGLRLCEPQPPEDASPVQTMSDRGAAVRVGSANSRRRKTRSFDPEAERRLNELQTLLAVHRQNLDDLQKQIESYNELPAPEFLVTQALEAKMKAAELKKEIKKIIGG